jgi:hypothetical protein
MAASGMPVGGLPRSRRAHIRGGTGWSLRSCW